MKNLVIFLLSTFLLTGCGLEADSINNDKYKNEKVEKLIEDYAPVEGVYEGTLTYTSSGESKEAPIEIRLKVLETTEGTGADGKPVPKVLLNGRYRRLDIVQKLDYMTFNSTYDKFTSKLIMAYNQRDVHPVFGSDLSTFLKGNWKNGSYEGTYELQNGVIGTFKVQRVSTMVPGATLDDEIEDYSKRWLKIHEPLEGRYEYCIKDKSGKRLYPALFQINIEYQGSLPTLRTLFDFKVWQNDFEVMLTYYQGSNKVVVEPLQNQGRVAKVNAKGSLKNGVLELNKLSGNRGLFGNGYFKGKRNRKISRSSCK